MHSSDGGPTIGSTGDRYELKDAHGDEILAYHFHPSGSSHITHLHLHVGSNDPRLNYGKSHLPTGLISLSEVVRCLIAEFGVPSRRADWADLLKSEPIEDQDDLP